MASMAARSSAVARRTVRVIGAAPGAARSSGLVSLAGLVQCRERRSAPMQYDRELRAALDAATLAAEVVLVAYADFRAIPDAPASISTQADKDSQETILRYL